MARKPILSAGIAMVSAAAVIAAGPSLFAPRSGRVEAAPGTKALENVHIGYRMTGISDISLGGFLDALTKGYTGGDDALDPANHPYRDWIGEPNGFLDADGKFVEDGEIGSLNTAAFYLVNNLLPAGVLADDYYFRWGLAAGTEVAVGQLAGGPDTLPVAAVYYLWNPVQAVGQAAEAVGKQFGYSGFGALALNPLMIPVVVADQVLGTDAGDIVYAVVTANVFAASGLTAKLVLQKVGDVTDVNILGTSIGTVVEAFSRFGMPDNAATSAGQAGADGTGAEITPANANHDAPAANESGKVESGKVEAGAAAVLETAVRNRQPAAVPAVEQPSAVDKALAAPAASPIASATDPSVATEFGSPVVGTLATPMANLAGSLAVKVPGTAGKPASGVPAADTRTAATKALDSKLGQRVQETTGRIAGGLRQAGKALSGVIGGAAKKGATQAEPAKKGATQAEPAKKDATHAEPAKKDTAE